MRARKIAIVVAAVAVAAVLVWRPWRDDEPVPAEDVAAAAVEPPAVAPPAPPPAEAVAAPGTVAASPAAPPPPLELARAAALARLPDAGVVPIVPTSENRGRLQELYKVVGGATPQAARLYVEFARAGRPVPPAARRLLEMKRAGASHDELADYVRSSFPESSDRAIAMRWLDAGVGAGPPVRGDGG